MKKTLLHLWHIIKGSFLIFISLLFAVIGKIFLGWRKIWLISERPNEARDNGYVFFEYLCNNHPEINAYYIIKKKSSDFKKIQELQGKYIKFQSLKHYFLFGACKYSISSTTEGLAPDTYLLKFQNKVGYPHKNIFLQHGVIDTNLDFLYRKFNNIDLFICGAQLEYDDVLSKYGYGKDAVAYTGLARFDNYFNLKLKNQILVMPTWRRGADDHDITSSDYFKYWTSFLNSRILVEMLESNNLTLYFYLHPVFQKYVDSFKSNSSSVIIANFESYDVQKLLKESKLLITDYSSILFDFAFMKKPSLYYQFDRDNYYKNHYKKGYFSYDKDSFGFVCKNENELIVRIEQSIMNNFEFPKEFENNFQRFFVKHDCYNCARIYNSIKGL